MVFFNLHVVAERFQQQLVVQTKGKAALVDKFCQRGCREADDVAFCQGFHADVGGGVQGKAGYGGLAEAVAEAVRHVFAACVVEKAPENPLLNKNDLCGGFPLGQKELSLLKIPGPGHFQQRLQNGQLVRRKKLREKFMNQQTQAPLFLLFI